MWIYIAVRMVAVPVLLFFILKAFKFDSIMILALCLMASMPVGNLPLIQAEKTTTFKMSEMIVYLRP